MDAITLTQRRVANSAHPSTARVTNGCDVCCFDLYAFRENSSLVSLNSQYISAARVVMAGCVPACGVCKDRIGASVIGGADIASALGPQGLGGGLLSDDGVKTSLS